MKALILLTIFAAATSRILAVETTLPIEGSPKVTPIHQYGGTVMQEGIAMSGDRHGCELSVATENGTYVFDWLTVNRFKFEQGASYRFILTTDRKLLSEIRSLDGKVVWKANDVFSRAETKLLRIHFADPTLIKG